MSNPGGKQKPVKGYESSVVRHAPDDHNYYYPDAGQMAHIRLGSSTPVLLPKALRNGRSAAFDPSVADVVHVDPDYEGGVVVDLRNIDPDVADAALQNTELPHEYFFNLADMTEVESSQPQAPVGTPPDYSEPPSSYGYVVPGSDSNGRQVSQSRKEKKVLPPAPQMPSFPQAAVLTPQAPASGPVPYQPPQQQLPPQYPQPQYQQPQPQFYAPPPVPPVDPNLQAMLGQVLQGISVLTQRVQAVEQRPATPAQPSSSARSSYPGLTPATTALRPRTRKPADDDDDEDEDNPYEKPKSQFLEDDDRPEPQTKLTKIGRKGNRPQHLDEYVEMSDDLHKGGIIVGFETLKLPYIDGPIPKRPRRKVIFEFPDAGKFMVWYHSVTESNNALILVYDARHEQGQQFEPPVLDDKVISVHVPHLKKTFKVMSIGISFSEGIFDYVVLLKNSDADNLDYDDDEHK